MSESLFGKVFIEKGLQYRCFSVNIAEFLRTAFLQKTSYDRYCLQVKMISNVFQVETHIHFYDILRIYCSLGMSL